MVLLTEEIGRETRAEVLLFSCFPFPFFSLCCCLLVWIVVGGARCEFDRDGDREGEGEREAWFHQPVGVFLGLVCSLPPPCSPFPYILPFFVCVRACFSLLSNTFALCISNDVKCEIAQKKRKGPQTRIERTSRHQPSRLE